MPQHPYATVEKDAMTGQWAVLTRASFDSNMAWTAIKGSDALCLDVANALEKHGYTVSTTRHATAGQNLRARKPAAESKPKRVSALDAAAQVLADAGQPMRARELIEAMAQRGL